MREDIAAMPVMEAAGWRTVLDYRDRQMNRQHNPNHPYSFKKGNMHIWRAVRWKENSIEWRYAELVDGHYTNHRWITIEEASKL